MATQFDVDVDLFIDGAWVQATDVGNGVRATPVTINTGRANWSARTETGRCTFLLDNRDGRWSPDYSAGAYSGNYKRNIPTRVGVAGDDVHIAPTEVGKDVVSTPDVLGVGGGSPTTPTVVSITQDSETAYTSTHTFNLPATVAAQDRLLLIANFGHTSASASTDLDDWDLVVSASMFTFSRVLVYERYVEDAATATALSGSTVTFSTTNGVKSSCQVWRVSGARSGGQGAAWEISAGTAYAFTANPNPDSLTVPWGADANLFIAFFAANGSGQAVTANPTGYTAGADGNTAAGYVVGSAHKAVSTATDDPATFTIAAAQNVLAWTFAYRAAEDTSADGVLDIAGDIDVRIEYQLLEEPPDDNGATRFMMATKGESAGSGWRLRLFRAQGYRGIGFIWRDSAGVRHNYEVWEATGVSVPWQLFHDRVAIKFTLDVNDGASDSVATFSWSATGIDGTYTTIGTDSGDGVVDLATNDEPIYLIGSPDEPSGYPVTPARLYKFQLRDGIDGTVVANPDFTAQTVGGSSFADAAGRTWTVGAGGRLTDKLWRFHGELSSLPVRWDIQGKDVTAPVEASGLFRRLRQGNRLVVSPIKRAIVTDSERTVGSNYVQYWPLEETGDEVTRFGAAVGTAPFTVEGGFPTTAANSNFIGSEPIPDPNLTTYICDVDTYTGTGQVQIRWLQSIGSALSLTDSVMLRCYTTDLTWEVQYRDNSPATGEMRMVALRGATTVYTSNWILFNAIGKDMRMTFNLLQVGSSITITLKGQQEDEVSAGGQTYATVTTGNVGTVTRLVWFPAKDWQNMAMGHVTLQTTITADDELADQLTAYDGETAAERIYRLCEEEDIPIRLHGDPADTEAMGPQRPGTLMDLIEECAATDLGLLFESRETVAVGYRTRTSMVAQTAAVALDYSLGELAASPELDRDDQGFSNDVTVENASGSTARAIIDDGTSLSVSPPPVGAGRYDTTYTVNAQDSRLPNLASTRLALTSVDEPRVSSLLLGLHVPAVSGDAALTADILGARLGDLITVSNNLTVALGTTQIQQIVQGWTETLEPFRHFIDLLTSPASPWGAGGDITDPPATHSVSFRSGQSLAFSGSPDHVLTALGYTSTVAPTRAQLDTILDDWVTSTGGTTHDCDTLAEWNTALGAAVPGDLIRATTTFDPADGTNVRGDLYGISGATLTSSTDGGQPGLPIIVTCADGVWIDPNNTANDDGAVDLQNCRHVWAVGLNVRNSQFGIRAWNWGGSDGFPAYIAYCNVDNMGHSGINCQGWFQLITDSGGTPPAGAANTYGFSEWFVVESNTVDGCGVTAAQFGEGIYIGKGSPGWLGYAKNAWIRGNSCTDWTSDGIDVKPGCQRVFVTDNYLSLGHAVSGAPMSILYCAAAVGARPSWYDLDPEIYVEGNRVYNSNITNTDVSSADIMGNVGLSGIRIANNIMWTWPTSGTNAAWRARMEIGSNDTEATNWYRTDETFIVNNTLWNNDSFEAAGYGASPTAFPSAVLAIFDLRNNIVDQGTPATGEVDAAAADFIATVPAIGVAGTAEWSTYGPGSAFDLALDSTLIGSGASIADLTLMIEQDISQRAINTAAPNPGAFQPHPANL